MSPSFLIIKTRIIMSLRRLLKCLRRDSFLFFTFWKIFKKFISVFIFKCFGLFWDFIATHTISLVVVLRGYSLVAGFELPAVVISLVTEWRLSSCGPRAWLLCSMWNPPWSEMELVFPALQGRVLTAGPPGKPLSKIFIYLAALGLSCLMWDLSLLYTDSLIAGLFALWYVGS